MLKNISLKNFKAFKNLEDLEIRPLTVLCGVNSGGKSSILKSLLLLKQSYENSSATNEATLNGIYTVNGLMKDILYNGKGETFTIKNIFYVKYSGRKYVKNSKQDVSTAKEIGKMLNLTSQEVSWFKIAVSCEVRKKEVSELWDTNFIQNYKIHVLPVSKNKKELNWLEFKIELIYRTGKKGKYDILLSNFPKVNGERVNYTLENCMCYFSGMRLTNLYYENNGVNNIDLSSFLTNIYSVFRIVSEQYNGIKYLGPLRENPKRLYSISTDHFPVDSTGADAPFKLAKNQWKKVICDLYPPAIENDFDKKINSDNENLLELVQKWMLYFDLGNIKIINQQESLQLNIKNCNIADVGFGISQTLPIIVEGLTLEYEQTLLLEQPEIHLHPRMQMRMADFLITLSQTNHCVIVETHSDHIINRLVRRVLENKDKNILNDLIIYFVTNSENGSEIQEIKVDRVRGIYEYPKEFFSQFASETSYIVQAGINNMKEIF